MKSDRVIDALLATSEQSAMKLGRAALWRPSYVRDDKILWHVPFIFWLLEMVRPRNYVEVGVGSGVGYLAVCQALHRMGGGARCYAVGEWTGEGRAAVLEEFSMRNSELYGDFSEILADDVDQAAKAVVDGSVDLMLLDLAAAPAVAATLHPRWYQKLSENGILLINGINECDELTKVLVNAVSANSPTVQLSGGDGLLVVLPGPGAGEGSQIISALTSHDPAQKQIAEIFQRLGAGIYLETHLSDASERVTELEEKAKSLWKERETLSKQLGELNAQYESRQIKTAMFQSRNFDLQQTLTAVQAETRRLDDNLAGALEEKARAHALLAEEHAARTDTEQKFEQAVVHANEFNARNSELEQALSLAEKQLKQLEAQLAAAQGERDSAQVLLANERSARAEAERSLNVALAEHQVTMDRLGDAEVALADAVRELGFATANSEQSRLQSLDFERAVSEYAENSERLASELLIALSRQEEGQVLLGEEWAARLDAERTLTEVDCAFRAELEKNNRIINGLIEIAEQNENLIRALVEELRDVRTRVRACFVPVGHEPMKTKSGYGCG